MTASGELEFLNRPVLEYFGKTLDELKTSALGMRFIRMIAGVLWPGAQSRLGPYEIEHRLRRFDGVYRWFQARGLAQRRAGGGIVRWYLLLTDIDDRKRSEEIARQSHLTIRSIIDSIPGYVHTMRADGSVEFVNQRILDFYQETTEELTDWAPLIHPEDREAVVSHWYASIRDWQNHAMWIRLSRRAWRDALVPLARSLFAMHPGRSFDGCNLLVDIDERRKQRRRCEVRPARTERNHRDHTGARLVRVSRW
jgi:PAS domain-containing protein